jgi:GrpB-like predicted nucleotidyltransferase (UPF0157 family)
MSSTVDVLTAAGLGLDYSEVRFGRTSRAWLTAGAELRNRVAECLAGLAAAVEVVGSASVLGLLAKPIIDLAAGFDPGRSVAAAVDRLQADGWIYRGDAGGEGGHVFVLESRPWYRVAHLHLVEYGDAQWRNYLRFRDLLRRRPDARERYEAVKLKLAEQYPTDRNAYTDGKTEVVTALLRGSQPSG